MIFLQKKYSFDNLFTMQSQKFSLKWDSFQTNTSQTFASLRSDEHFCDVTLVGDDHCQVLAHKVILSAGSAYFKEVLKNNKHPYPLLLLQGITTVELTGILDFIYNGELQLHQDHLERFLGHALRLGLQGVKEEKDDAKTDVEVKVETTVDLIPEENVDSEQIHITVDGGVKNDKMKDKVSTKSALDLSEINKKLNDSLTLGIDGTYICNHCPKTTIQLCHMREHAETHLKDLIFPCQKCDWVSKTRNGYRHHQRTHLCRTFECQLCKKVFKSPSQYRIHEKKHKY